MEKKKATAQTATTLMSVAFAAARAKKEIMEKSIIAVPVDNQESTELSDDDNKRLAEAIRKREKRAAKR